MLAIQLAAAIEAVRPSQLDDISRTLWRAHGAGLVTAEEAERLAEAVEARRALRKVIQAAQQPALRRVGSRPKSTESLERRRRWVAAGLLPPQLAASFTSGESSVLAVIALQISKRRACSLPIGAIAALAGVGRTTAQNALRRAKALGLITVRERRRTSWRNDTNIVAIVSPEWRAWLRLAETRKGWVQFREPHDFKIQHRPAFAPFDQALERSRDRFCRPPGGSRAQEVESGAVHENSSPGAPMVV